MSARRLLPIIILLLLVGAGGYIYLQGGPDYVLATIDRILGKDKPPPLVKTTRKDGDKVATPTTAIPETPLKGQLSGQVFTLDLADIENGILTLRQGKGFFPDRGVTIFLFTNKWEIPFGKTYTVTAYDPSFGSKPHVHLKYKVAGKNVPETEMFLKGYSMTLVFGQEKNKKIPVKIYLKLPSRKHSEIAGTFMATIKGFRLVDGKPDLTLDNFDNLKYLALYDVLKSDPKQDIQDIKHHDTRFQSYNKSQPKHVQSGSLDMEYRIGAGETQTRRYQFVKEDGTWRVLRTLEINQVHEAHPYKAPDENSSTSDQLRYLTAEALEQHATSAHNGMGLYNVQYSYRYQKKNNIAQGTARYTLERGSKDRHEVSYFYRYTKQGWVLRGVIRPDQKLDMKTGKIVSKAPAP